VEFIKSVPVALKYHTLRAPCNWVLSFETQVCGQKPSHRLC